MTDTIRQHEAVDGVCRHCGTHEPFNERTCVSRETGKATEARPEPAERRYAVYDNDTISTRLKELEAERLAIAARPPEAP